MFSTLLRRLGLLPGLLLFLLGLGTAHPVLASHLLGGEMTYKYLDANGPASAPHRYEITLKVYNNCNASSTLIQSSYPIAIYNQGSGTKLTLTSANYNAISSGNLIIPELTPRPACSLPNVPAGCTITPGQLSYIKQTFVAIVNLPASTVGYYAAWSSSARNNGIANVAANNENMGLYCTMAPPALANSSPVFVNDAVANICSSDTTYILNNAVDPDGDQLVYSFGTPYINGLPTVWTVPPAQIGFNFGYDVANPLGTPASFPGNYANVNPATGISKYLTTAGLNTLYVIAVDVSEYRTINNRRVLIGTTRRDVQLVTVTCPGTPAPVLPTATGTPRNYTIEAGSTLTIPLAATQISGHPLKMTVSSVLLDSTGGYNASFNNHIGTLLAGTPSGSATAGSATGTVAANFVYNSTCTQARTTPYDVVVLVEDKGCAGKTGADILHITVVKPSGPTDITGDFAVCGLPASRTYTAVPGAAPTAPTINWRVVGGTIVGSNTANPVTVNWTTPGTGTIVARGVSQYGCFTDSVTKTVTLGQAPALAVTGNQTICAGASTTLTVTGGPAPYTVMANGTTLMTGAGPFTLSPAATTSYTITATATGTTCGASTQVTVTVQPKPTANAGAAVAICAGGSAQLGAAPVAGNTYSWSPSTGLSSATVANPTITLTNTTGSPLTQTYTLTVTNGICQATSSVAVTVAPTTVAAAGAPVTTCSGSPAQLGAAPVAGNTYSWSPATGLSSATVANPTVTLTNTTGSPVTQTYTLTVTNATNCVSTGTVAVTVNPLPVAVPGAAVAFCSGSSAQLGASPVNGLTYSWSPATGLSSATVANPTITLTNTTGSPVTQAYTLTTTTAAGCTATGTVAVMVNPLPTVAPGAAVAFCSGSSAQLGAAPVTGFTYRWSPATGLSSATAANPTVTLTNTTGSPVTQTYTLTVTSAATACVSTGTVAVTVNPLPVAVPGSAVAFCSGGSAPLGASPVSGLTYSWSPTTGLSNPAIANPTVTLTNSTGSPITQTYTLTVTNAATACVSTGTVVVMVNPLPTVTPGAAVAFCTGGSARLGASPVSGLTYSWSPTTGLSSATSANPTVTLTNTTSAPVTQTYTLTVTNSGTSCVNTDTVAVTVNPLPTVTPGAAVAFCSGGSAQLGAAPVTGFTYRWSPATGLSSATAANPTVTLTNTTGSPVTQTYTLTVTNATNCVNTGTVAVTVNPLPTVTPGAAVAFCSGGSAQLGASPISGLTYSWSPATGLSSATVANPTVTLTNTTGSPVIQTYTLTVTNVTTTCTATGTVAVMVNPLPTVAPGAAVAFCSGGSAQLGAAPVTGFTYRWSPATGLSSATVANPTITLTNTTGSPVTQTYTLTVTNATSCVSTGTVAVTVNPLPVAVPGAALTICSGGLAQLGATPVSGLTYSWSPAAGLSDPTAANPTVTLTNTTTAATTQTYTLTVTNATNCVNTGTVAVTVNPLPVAIAGPPVTFCSGNTAQLGANPLAGLAYSWSPSTGLSNSAIANPSITLTNATGTAITPTYTLTVTNPATGCVRTSTVVVTVNSEILPGIVGPSQTVCASSTPTPLASTPGATGGYGNYRYQWESSPDNVTWTPIAGATSATYAPGPLAATTYYRRRVASGSCADAVSDAVRLELMPQLVTGVTLATPPTQCAGLPITFTPVPTNAGSAPSYRWFVNNVPVASGPTFTSTTLVNGDVVRVEVTPTPGFCATSLAIASVTVNLTLVAQPTATIRTQTLLPICAGSPVAFVIDNTTNAGTNPTYQWQVNGVNVPGATGATFTSTTLTDGQIVTLVLTTPSPCGPVMATSNGLTIGVNPFVQVNAGPDKTIMEGETVELEGTANGNFPITWTPNLGFTFSSNNPLRPTVAPIVTTTYTLAVQVGNCYSESKVTITVTPRVRIPNAFTPNGDGLDDTWQIDRIGDYTSNHVIIFNRWGSKLFETTNYNHGNEWNGTISGQPAPIGTYYYLITLGNGKSYTGPLTVVY